MARSKAVGPNSRTKKEAARKAQKCQLCGTKVGRAKAKSVVVDPPGVGDVSIVKAREGKSYWCGDCAKKKAALYEAAIARKDEKPKAKPKAKKSAAKKTRKTTAKKRTTRKGGEQTAAARRRERTRKSMSGEPF